MLWVRIAGSGFRSWGGPASEPDEPGGFRGADAEEAHHLVAPRVTNDVMVDCS